MSRSRTLLLTVPVLALGVAAPSAHAASQSTGGCAFVSITDRIAGQGQQSGVLAIAVYASSQQTLLPASATVNCYITVNGAKQAGSDLAATGTGAIANAGVATYASTDFSDDIQLCLRIDYADSTPDVAKCEMATQAEFLAGVVRDEVDPARCAVLAAAAGSYGPVSINAQGDVYVGGAPFWDCPPDDMTEADETLSGRLIVGVALA